MKTIKILFPFFCLSLFVSSCSGDGPLAKVKYQINGLDVSVVDIKYKNAQGNIIDITNPNNFGSGSDSRTINVSNLPFPASLEITVNNTTPSVKTYDLVIFVNGDPVDTTNLSAPSGAVTTGQVDFVVEP